MALSRGRSWLVGAVLVAAICAMAAKQYTPPRAMPAKTYAAHDEHPTEYVTIAADPYDTTDKTSVVFILPYREKGYLPIYLVVTNDGDQPVSLVRMQATLTTGSRAKLQPSSSDDLYRRFSRVKRRGDEPSRNPLPIPLPRHPDTGLPKGAADEVQNSQFGAKAVEPHTTQAGFLFFDVQDVRQPLAGSHLYVTGVRDARGNELMFFDIALDNSTGAAPVK